MKTNTIMIIASAIHNIFIYSNRNFVHYFIIHIFETYLSFNMKTLLGVINHCCCLFLIYPESEN